FERLNVSDGDAERVGDLVAGEAEPLPQAGQGVHLDPRPRMVRPSSATAAHSPAEVAALSASARARSSSEGAPEPGPRCSSAPIGASSALRPPLFSCRIVHERASGPLLKSLARKG